MVRETNMQGHNWKRQILEYSKLLGVLWFSGFFVMQALWWALGDEMSMTLRELAGVHTVTDQLSEGFERVDGKLDSLEEMAVTNAQNILAITPVPAVAVYDPAGSKAWIPCYDGTPCTVQYRAKRTVFGLDCGRPKVLRRVFTDRTSQQYIVEPGGANQIVKLDEEYTTVSSSFIPPRGLGSTVGVYQVYLEYDCLGRIIEESTLALTVHLEERKP